MPEYIFIRSEIHCNGLMHFWAKSGMGDRWVIPLRLLLKHPRCQLSIQTRKPFHVVVPPQVCSLSFATKVTWLSLGSGSSGMSQFETRPSRLRSVVEERGVESDDPPVSATMSNDGSAKRLSLFNLKWNIRNCHYLGVRNHLRQRSYSHILQFHNFSHRKSFRHFLG